MAYKLISGSRFRINFKSFSNYLLILRTQGKAMSTLPAFDPTPDQPIIREICDLNWQDLSQADMTAVAWAYYYFSVQFRQNLQLACEYFADDANLARLKDEECDTDNLSPYPGIAVAGERMNHDTFMLRALRLSYISEHDLRRFEQAGKNYDRAIMSIRPKARALSIGSYERGGLERLFRAILQAPDYDDATIEAFQYFMEAHIRFDSDPIEGHGALSRQMTPDESVIPLWEAFRNLLLECAPNLLRRPDLPQPALATAAAL
jgi:hypothetical protein